MSLREQGSQSFLLLAYTLGGKSISNFAPLNYIGCKAENKRPMQPKASKKKRGK